MSPTRTSQLSQATRRLGETFSRRVPERLGGRARAFVIFLLACVLALESADAATIGATAVQLEHSLDINNAQVGLLVSVSTGVGAVATLPAGALTDRVNRTAMLAMAILAWAIAMGLGALSPTYLWLLCTRVALGAVVATASPVVASLIGDYFPEGERGRIYGFILSGELVGAGIGLVISGDVSAAWSWRYAFGLLAVPSVVLAWAIWRRLPEPARDGSSRLTPGTEELDEVAGTARPGGATQDENAAEASGQERDDQASEEVREEHVSPHEDLVLDRDPSRRSIWWAVRYVLSIRTNRILIASSALGFFFFSGLRTFTVVFLRGRYGLDQGVTNVVVFVLGLGAIAGVLVGGRLADELLSRHHLTARPLVAGFAFLVTSFLFLPGLSTSALFISAPLFFIAAAALGGANPPMDAARLDLMPARLWGRAEAVRTVLRYALGAVAPVLFGYLSTQLGGAKAPSSTESGRPMSAHAAAGLAETFQIMLIPLLVAGVLIVVWARRTYPRDVATAVASDEAIKANEAGTARRAD